MYGDTRVTPSCSPRLLYVLPNHCSPPRGPQAALGLLQLLVQVLQVLLQCLVSLLQLLVFRAGDLLGALEASAAPLQLWDNNQDTDSPKSPQIIIQNHLL